LKSLLAVLSIAVVTMGSLCNPNHAPVVAWKSPADGSVLPRDLIFIEVEVTDADDNLNGVEFFADGVSLGWGNRGAGPDTYFAHWDASQVSSGTHVLRVNAFDHEYANTDTSVTVTVQ
jgi:hypothetical protein